MITRCIFIFVLSSLLFACGGGSSGGSGSSTSTATSQPPPPPRLQAKVVNVNRCGVETPATDARLIVHNDDFTNRSVHKPDSNGLFSIELDDERATVSLLGVRKSNYWQEDETLTIDTFVDIAPIDLGTWWYDKIIEDDPLCTCNRITLISSAPNSGFPDDYRLSSSGTRVWGHSSPIWEGNLESTAEICRKEGENWPVITAMLRFGDITYFGSVKDYDPASTIYLDLVDIAPTVTAPLDPEITEYSSSVSIDGNRYRSFLHESNEIPYISNEDSSLHRFSARKTDPNVYIQFQEGLMWSFSEIETSDPSNIALDFTFYDEEAFSRNVAAALQAGDLFDFTSNAPADIFRLRTRIRPSDGGADIVYWDIHSAPSGSLGSIDNFSIEGVDIQINNNSIPDSARIHWELYDDSSASGFEEFWAMPPRSSNESYDQNWSRKIIVFTFENYDIISPVTSQSIPLLKTVETGKKIILSSTAK